MWLTTFGLSRSCHSASVGVVKVVIADKERVMGGIGVIKSEAVSALRQSVCFFTLLTGTYVRG